MKRAILLILSYWLFTAVNAQEFTATELLSLSSLPPQKFDNAISKKGFAKDMFTDRYRYEALVHIYQQKTKAENQPVRYAEKYEKGKEQFLVFKTSSLQEFHDIKLKLKQDGFFYAADSLQNGKEILFQKKNIVVAASRVIENTDTLYVFRFENKVLPAPSSVRFADDLLQFDSHQHLVTIFGTGNVLKDVYYFNNNELSNCSVLFPNSSRQAVFIWKDEENLTGLASLIVGGGLRVGDDLNNTSHVVENSWMLRNGIHPNMSLKKLLEMNETDFGVYGKESPYFMKVMPDSSGALNFKDISVVLGCLNCSGTRTMDGDSFSAEAAVERNLSLHVLMVILSKKDD
jgi:hypothetical protein